MPNKSEAVSLVQAVRPDNLDMQGLSVKTVVGPKSVVFNVVYSGRLETFISTLDDLLRCLQAAKGTIEKIIE